MKTLLTLIIFCIVVCTNLTHGQFVLTVRCEGMEAYINKAFHVRVTEAGSGQEVGRKSIPSIPQDTFEFELYVLLDGVDYQVDFYVDQDDDESYDPPPFDHAWRRMVINPSGDVEILFTPGFDYTDLSFSDDFRYGRYNSVWGGKWMNLTFGSTDSIEAAFEITCDSLFISLTTAGVFGNPDTVTFDFEDARRPNFNPVTDTLHFTIDTPWAGEVYTINGELHGHLTLMDIELKFSGTLGLQQLLCHYTVTNSGSPLANGYFYLKELEVIFIIPPLAIELVGTPVLCHGGTDGSVWSEVSGGTMDYSYLWSPTGTSLPHLEGIPAGTFTLVVTDSEGCSIEASYTLHDPESIIIDVYTSNESCPGACDAIIELAVSGEHPPYSITSEGDSCTGFITIFVTDDIGCVDSTEVFIGTDSDMSILGLITTDATNGQADGSVEVNVGGGIEPYLYSIDGIFFQLSTVFTGLPPGSYCITIQDANGCFIKTDTFVIYNITAIHEIFPGLTVYPNPTSSQLYVTCDQLLSLDLMDLNGTLLKQSPLSRTHEVRVEEFPRGMYLLRLSGASGHQFQKLILD